MAMNVDLGRRSLDDILANHPATQLYKFTEVDDQVVDPTNMRVIAVIDSRPAFIKRSRYCYENALAE
jgi:hypothetical protein